MLSRNKKVYGITLIVGVASFITVTVLMKKGIINLSKFNSSQINSIITGIFFSTLISCWLLSLLINDIIKEKEEDQPRIGPRKYLFISSMLAFTIIATLMKNKIINLGDLSSAQVNGIIAAAFFITCYAAMSVLIGSVTLDKNYVDRCKEKKHVEYYYVLDISENNMRASSIIIIIIITIIVITAFIAFATIMKNRLINLDKFTNSQVNGLIAGAFFSLLFLGMFTMAIGVVIITARSDYTTDDIRKCLEKEHKNNISIKRYAKNERWGTVSFSLFLSLFFIGLLAFTVIATVMKNVPMKGLEHLTTHQLNGAIFGVFCGVMLVTVGIAIALIKSEILYYIANKITKDVPQSVIDDATKSEEVNSAKDKSK